MNPMELRSGPAFADLGLSLLEIAAAVGRPPASKELEAKSGRGSEGSSGADSRGAASLGADSWEAASWEAKVSGVATDSRAAGSSMVFFALKGDNADGHDFLPQALAKGAMAAVVEDGHEALLKAPENAVLIRVPDTTAALGDLARSVRARVAPKVAAVTGSSGKTTVKELLRSIFELAAGDPATALATAGNLNNHVGLPLTLLSMGPETRLAAVELGASRAGEIAWLTSVSKPDVGVVTMAGEAHLEHFGSVEGVARAKGELYSGLGPAAVAVVNLHNRLMGDQAANFPGNKLYFGLSDAKVSLKPALGAGGRLGGVGAKVLATIASDLGMNGQKLVLRGPGLGLDGVSVDFKLRGRHNALNAAAAAAASVALGLDWEHIARGLAAAEPPAGRLAALKGAGGVWVIDDSYNANPNSMEAAMAFLGSLAGRKAAILGDMLELGDESAALHRRLGEAAARIGLEKLALVGTEVGPALDAAIEAGLGASQVKRFDDPREAALWAAKGLASGASVLVKGSRAMALEKAVAALAT